MRQSQADFQTPDHPLHPRPYWVKDGILVKGPVFDLAAYAEQMQQINDIFMAPSLKGIFPGIDDGRVLAKEEEPKKGQTKEELKRQREGKPADHMNLSTRGKALFAWRLLNEWWDNPDDTNWPKEMIVKWANKTVRALLDTYHVQVHYSRGLCDHLEPSLKRRLVGAPRPARR